MEDPVFVSMQSLDRAAARMLGDDAHLVDAGEGRTRVEMFLFRTGRPLPHVIVVGGELAVRARQIDELGGAAVGVDAGESTIVLANQSYPGGHFLRGDPRDPPVSSSAFDGAWTGGLPGMTPKTEVVKTFGGVHKVLRPGGLLYVQLPLGDEEGFEETDDGPVFRSRWVEAQFVEAIGALDFDRIDREELGENEVGLTFRKEY